MPSIPQYGPSVGSTHGSRMSGSTCSTAARIPSLCWAQEGVKRWALAQHCCWTLKSHICRPSTRFVVTPEPACCCCPGPAFQRPEDEPARDERVTSAASRESQHPHSLTPGSPGRLTPIGLHVDCSGATSRGGGRAGPGTALIWRMAWMEA